VGGGARAGPDRCRRHSETASIIRGRHRNGISLTPIFVGDLMSYMELRSVDANSNRRRRYGIVVQQQLDGSCELIVTWGRIGGRSRIRVERFESTLQMQRRLGALLTRRKRHGYEPVRTSAEAEPLLDNTVAVASATLTVDHQTRFIPMRQANGYLGIFDSQRQGYIVRDLDPAKESSIVRAVSAMGDAEPLAVCERVLAAAA